MIKTANPPSLLNSFVATQKRKRSRFFLEYVELVLNEALRVTITSLLFGELHAVHIFAL